MTAPFVDSQQTFGLEAIALDALCFLRFSIACCRPGLDAKVICADDLHELEQEFVQHYHL